MEAGEDEEWARGCTADDMVGGMKASANTCADKWADKWVEVQEMGDEKNGENGRGRKELVLEKGAAARMVEGWWKDGGRERACGGGMATAAGRLRCGGRWDGGRAWRRRGCKRTRGRERGGWRGGRGRCRG